MCAFVVVTDLPVADSGGAACLNTGSLLHGHVEHASHTYCNHSGLNLVILFLFECLFEFFQFGVVHVSLEGGLIYKLVDYLLTNFYVSLYLIC